MARREGRFEAGCNWFQWVVDRPWRKWWTFNLVVWAGGVLRAGTNTGSKYQCARWLAAGTVHLHRNIASLYRWIKYVYNERHPDCLKIETFSGAEWSRYLLRRLFYTVSSFDGVGLQSNRVFSNANGSRYWWWCCRWKRSFFLKFSAFFCFQGDMVTFFVFGEEMKSVSCLCNLISLGHVSTSISLRRSWWQINARNMIGVHVDTVRM